MRAEEAPPGEAGPPDPPAEASSAAAAGGSPLLPVAAAAAFGAGVWALRGGEAGQEWFAGYLLEQSLSVDNLFVFVLVFDYFKVPRSGQDKVLSYGIWSTAVLRACFVLVGAELLESFEPVLLVFAAFLVDSSYQILLGDEDEEEDFADNGIVKFFKGVADFSDDYDGDNFFTLQEGVRTATPLLLVLATIEVSDLIFAVDSIPAVFGVTRDPFIVYSSNMFAILSLRSLYTFVSESMSELEYLDRAVGLVLGFIGAKMIAGFAGLEISTAASLGVVCTLLGGGVVLSLPNAGAPPEE